MNTNLDRKISDDATDVVGEVGSVTTEREEVSLVPKPVKPTTKQAPVHSNATAKIYFDGLSILCFNEERQTTEIVFVREGHLPVQLDVFKSSDCTEPIYSFAATDGVQVRIDIRKWSLGTQQHDGGLYYEDQKSQPEDFEWVPDICKWYGASEVTFRPGAKNHLSAKLVLLDAVFYTKQKSTIAANLVNWPSPWKEQVARVVGANIECGPDDDGISLEITGEPRQEFSKDDGPYFITVRTEIDEHGGHMNHMDHVYNKIIDLQGAPHRYYLQFKPSEKRLGFDCSSDTFKESMTKSTEYACQTHGGGNGDPPDIP